MLTVAASAQRRRTMPRSAGRGAGGRISTGLGPATGLGLTRRIFFASRFSRRGTGFCILKGTFHFLP